MLALFCLWWLSSALVYADEPSSMERYVGNTFLTSLGAYQFKYGEKEDHDFEYNTGPQVGIELEKRYANGFAFGIGYHYLENHVINTEVNRAGKVKARFLLFPLKFYINNPSRLTPVVGMALGRGSADTDIPARGYSDFVTQLFTGVTYVKREIEYQLLYQSMLARLHESGGSICILDCGGNLDISGRALVISFGIRY